MLSLRFPPGSGVSAAPSDNHEGYLPRFEGLAGWVPYIIEHVEEAKRLMRDPEVFYDLERYRWANSVLQLACDLAALPHHPALLAPHKYVNGIKLTFGGLLEATKQRPDNLFYEIFRQKVIPALLALDPLLVGISVTYHFQVLPGFTLGRLLKREAPDLHVTIGGAIVSRMESHILCNPGFFEFADSFVIGEGETALRMLAESLRLGQGPPAAPNLVCNVGGRPAVAGFGHIERTEDFPCPDFDGLELERYLSPEPILLLPSTRGCYWGKCAFCDVSHGSRRAYRPVHPDQLSRHVTSLHKRYGARRFVLCDDAVPLPNMKEMARLVKNDLPDVTWQGEARFEQAMSESFIEQLHAGGCRHLTFGLESASQRVLELMNKNNRIENDKRILRLCAENGIAVNVQTFLGFPTEIREEALSTCKLLEDYEYGIASFGFAIFSLYEGTPVYCNPARYGVTNLSVSLAESLLASCDFETSSGMTRWEVREFHDSALARLGPLYATRCDLLGGGAGHTLLQLSHYPYHQLYRLWKQADEPRWRDGQDISGTLPRLSSTVLLSPASPTPSCAAEGALCTRTGKIFNLLPGDRRLLELCDGQRTVADVASLWAGKPHASLDDQILGTARAVALVHSFLREGLLTSPCEAGS